VTLDRTTENYVGYETTSAEPKGIRAESHREPMRSCCGEGPMLTREQIIQSFVAKADAQYLEYCKIRSIIPITRGRMIRRNIEPGLRRNFFIRSIRSVRISTIWT